MSFPTRALRSTLYALRTEGQGSRREACAIGVGLFIGCSPFYGLHLLISWVCGWLLGLNRLKVYLAANISNPVVAPILVLAEIQTGAWLRTGSFLTLTIQTLRTVRPWQFGVDLLLGSLVVGCILGGAGGLATFALLRRGRNDPFFDELTRRASERYVTASMTAWEFARGKLRGDPLYREVLFGGLFPSGGTLLDIGCGQGLMLSMLAEGQLVSRDGMVPRATQLPGFDRMVGIELRPHRARLARAALGSDAEILEFDARTALPRGFRVIFLFDVLHMMSEADQEALLSTAIDALEPGGVILVREADASAGWRFWSVRIGNRLTALISGAWRQGLVFRTAGEWRQCFSQHGLDAECIPASAGTPFANYLFRLTVRSVESATICPREQSA